MVFDLRALQFIDLRLPLFIWDNRVLEQEMKISALSKLTKRFRDLRKGCRKDWKIVPVGCGAVP